MPDRLDQALQDCLELLERGHSLEKCLARHPEDADELGPLLQLALDTRSRATGEATDAMPLAARSRIRGRVLAEWDRRHHRRQRAWGLRLFAPRWAAAAAAFVLLVVLGSTGTVAAAGSAVPGDPLYLVKEMREDTRLWFARSPEAKVDIYTKLVRERVRELQELTSSGRGDDSSVTLDRLEGHISHVTRLVEEKAQAQRLESGPPAEDNGFMAGLQEIISEQQSAEGILRMTIEEAPAEAQPGLWQALDAIQRGHDRVRSALGAVRPPAPGDSSPAPADE